jgi:sulfate adenylyltransferase/3'-phosphoadenosine 5'-phosphosulfate synthase
MPKKKGFVLWFTGLSGSGKSTLARMVEEKLLERGLNVEVLDGDEMRTHLCKGLGFSKEDRDTNIRRIGYVAKIVARNGACAITAAISPYREIRDEVRKGVEEKSVFVEAYLECPIEKLMERDVKGLYKKALAGEIKHFTGVDDPYEPPLKPEVIVHTSLEPERQSCARIMKTLEMLELAPAVADDDDYAAAEEAAVAARLKDLGYLG